MRTLKQITNDLGITLDFKHHKSYSERVYVHNTKDIPEITRFNLIAELYINTNVNFDNLHKGIIKKGQRAELFLFQLLDVVVYKSDGHMMSDEKKENFRRYLNKDMSLTQLKKIKYE